MMRRLLYTATAVVMVGGACIDPAQAETFVLGDQIDFSRVDRIGDLDWDYTLGTSWNDNFSLGGIVGKKNATVIPEIRLPNPVPPFHDIVIPAVTADTRTGARMSGHVSGGTGLDFWANFQASGLSPESNFQFMPSVEIPSGELAATTGEFFALKTNPGLVTNPAFSADQVDLPSFNAGMDFFFELDLDSRIEGGLFPIIPYFSTDFSPPKIDVKQSLFEFEFDLDPQSNPDLPGGTPPMLTLFKDHPFPGVEQEIRFLDDLQASVLSHQISVHIGDKNNPGVTRRLDIGEVELVNPFGFESIVDPQTNLTVSTSMGQRSVGYSFETPLLRMGIDLDGIAAFLATSAVTGVGESFTRIEEDIKINNEKIAEITADLIDIKYGPEIGYRESVEIKPDFDVTLQFDRQVAVKDDDGIRVVPRDSKIEALSWNDLPEISLLDDEPVQVTVQFNELTGEQSKRGLFYLTDYLELTLLEIEDVTVFDTFSHSLPPLIQERTSLLGKLLGQVELDVFNGSQPINDNLLLDTASQNHTFMLQAAPSLRLYRTADLNPDNPASLADWRSLDDHTQPGSLNDKVLVIGLGDDTTTHVAQLRPMGFEDAPPNETVTLGQLFRQQTGLDPAQIISPSRSTIYPDVGEPIDVQGLEIIAGSHYRHTSGGIRRWNLHSIRNDGQFNSNRSIEIIADDELLHLTGGGNMTFQGPTAIRAEVLFNGEGHSLAFLNAEGLNISQQSVTVRYSLGAFSLNLPVTVPSVTTDDRPLKANNVQNAGTIRFTGTNATIPLSGEFANASTGTLWINSGSVVTLTTPRIVQDGLVDVSGRGTTLRIEHPETFGQINVQSTTGTGQFIARDGATLHFTDTLLLETPAVEPNPLRFEAKGGGTVQFDGPIRAFEAGVAELHVDEGSTLILNGVEVMRREAQVSLVNRGLVEVQGGTNRLYYDPPGEFDPDKPDSRIVGINIVNEGVVRIEPRVDVASAQLGFEAEIKNYVPGGAVLGPGTWELIGEVPDEPYRNEEKNVFGVRTAELEILIKRIFNEDAYIGMIDFGDTDGDGSPDGYSAEDYDTFLAISEADVLLSGAARFDYFNTIRDNLGSLTLRNKNHFTTDGDLVNRGEIRLESGSGLFVNGDFVVDEGTVLVDRSSGLLAGANTVEVIGGNLTYERDAGSTIALASTWIVREKWVGEDADGDDIIREGRISFGDLSFHTIGRNSRYTLDGERAVFEAIEGLGRIQGELTLTGGNELHLAQNLTNEGTLTLAKAGKLYVDGDLLTSGQLNVGADSYLDVTGAFTAMGGAIQLDGVTHAPNLTVDDNTSLNGAGHVAGNVENNGLVSPGNSPGTLQVSGDYTQSADATLAIDIMGLTIANDAFDQLAVTGTATLDGLVDVTLSDGFALDPGQQFAVVTAAELVDGGLQLAGSAAGYFDLFVNSGAEGSIILEFLGGEFTVPGDYNDNGLVEQRDLDLVLVNWGADGESRLLGWINDRPSRDTTEFVSQVHLDAVLANWGKSLSPLAAGAVPEPTGLALAFLSMLSGSVFVASRRR